MRHICNAQKLPWSAVLDLRQAYPSIPRDKIMSVAKRKLPQNLVNMVAAMLQPLKIVSRGGESKKYGTIARGVPQGSPLSPSLFDLVMDTLAEHLEGQEQSNTGLQENSQTYRGWDICMFADDVKLQAQDKSTLQFILHSVNSWAVQNSMSWGIEKCAILGPDTTTEYSTAPLVIGGRPISYKTEMEYLGMTVTAGGTAATKNLERIKNAKARLHRLRHL